MENAADAFKMAGAAMFFVLAFTIAIGMFSRARNTSDAILGRLQNTQYFEKVTPLPNNVTREVGVESVIPTLFRYAQSDANIRIIILNSSGEEHQVFDQDLEDEIGEAARKAETPTPYEQYLLDEYNVQNTLKYMFETPWRNQSDVSYRIERINAYIYGTTTKHMKRVRYDGNIINANNRGLLGLIAAAKAAHPSDYIIFEESYVEYNTSGTVEKDEYDEEVVTKPANTKTIITYKINNRSH